MPARTLERGEQGAVGKLNEAVVFAGERGAREGVEVKPHHAGVDVTPAVALNDGIRAHDRLQIPNRRVWIDCHFVSESEPPAALHSARRLYQVISRPDTRNVSAVAALAVVEMKSPGFKTWPTNSGQRYVSSGTRTRASMTRFELAGEPPEFTRFTEKLRFTVSVFVTVALSMIARTRVAVY
jgi:hypothetical protein